jgi:predicted GTPase/uncharacterized protein (DUF697 family)
MDTSIFSDMAKKALEEAYRERSRINILIAGKTGAGKTTLINQIFQGKMGETGQGRPVTMNTREISEDGLPLTIFDTRGLELDKYNETYGQLEQLINDRNRRLNAQEHIHVAWICIVEETRRVEKTESDLVTMLDKHMPVIGVITRAISDQGFRSTAQALMPQARNVMRVVAEPIPIKLDDQDIIIPQRGLPELIDVTMQAVPEGQRRALTAVQMVDLSLKRQRSHTIVITNAALAAGAGGTPIPGVGISALVPLQMAMIAGIAATYGLSFSGSFLTSVLGTMGAAAGAPVATKFLVSEGVKLIPGLNIYASYVAAASAFAVTTAFGEAFIAVMDYLFQQNSGQPPTEAQVLEEIKKRLS